MRLLTYFDISCTNMHGFHVSVLICVLHTDWLQVSSITIPQGFPGFVSDDQTRRDSQDYI